MNKVSSGATVRNARWRMAGLLAVALSHAGVSSATITEFELPNHSAAPNSVVAGPDGNLWFTEFESHRIGTITPEGQITEFPLRGTIAPNPISITVGPDAALWFLEADRVGRMTTDGRLREFKLPFGRYTEPLGITTGPDGNLWFTESRCAHCDPNAAGQLPDDGATIGRITPDGEVTEFTLPDYHAGPRGITTGPDGNLWFTESVSGKIARMTLSGAVTEFVLPVPHSAPMGIVAASDGNLWFVESRCSVDCGYGDFGSEVIGRITPAGVITEFATTSRKWFDGPLTIAIVEGADHALWFAEPGSNRIGRITFDGQLTEFDVPRKGNSGLSTDPVGVAAAADGTIWFVESALGYGGRVGRLDPSSTAQPNKAITSGFTGNWYGPGQPGHGFSIEIGAGNQMLAEWFTFAPTGGQSWILATGEIHGDTAELQGFQAAGPGGLFPPAFDPTRIEAKAWGTITFTFTDCNNGLASWQPVAPGYTSGSMAITRLTMPLGLSCE